MITSLLVLAVDGLDWGLMQSLADAGGMPHMARLLDSGTCGRLAVPAPTNPASAWTTVATGTMADRHGICHEWSIRPDGLSLGVIGSESLQYPTLWQRAMSASIECCVVGWPTVLPSDDWGDVDPQEARSLLVAAGFDSAQHATLDVWPLSPAAVQPIAARVDVLAALVHPLEVPAEAVAELLASVPVEHYRDLEGAARELVARWSSIQALTLPWARGRNPGLMALRFDGLVAWMSRLAMCVGPQLPNALKQTYAWLDMIVGQQLQTMGAVAHVALLSLHGLPQGGYREGANALASLYDAPPSGGIVLAGPKVPVDGLLLEASAVDVCPTLAALLGLVPDGAASDGRDLLTAGARWNDLPRQQAMPELGPPVSPVVAQDVQALEWLETHGIPRADISALQDAARAVEDSTLTAWAEARLQRGASNEALDVLHRIVQRSPAHLPSRMALGRGLLSAGRAAECNQLLHELPPQALGREHDLWFDAFQAIVARAQADHTTAEACLLRLVHAGKAPINAPAWLGWLQLDRRDPDAALSWFTQALRWPGETAWVFEGMGLAHLRRSQHSDAVRDFTRAISEQPSCARLHAHRALAWERGHELEAAERGWQRAIELDPGQPSHVSGLARVWAARQAER